MQEQTDKKLDQMQERTDKKLDRMLLQLSQISRDIYQIQGYLSGKVNAHSASVSIYWTNRTHHAGGCGTIAEVNGSIIVVTCRHVAELFKDPESIVTLMIENHQVIDVSGWYLADEKVDLAYGVVSKYLPQHEMYLRNIAVSIASEEISPGMKVSGYARYYEAAVQGHVVSVDVNRQYILQTSISGKSGYSGTGLLNHRSELVAVHVTGSYESDMEDKDSSDLMTTGKQKCVSVMATRADFIDDCVAVFAFHTPKNLQIVNRCKSGLNDTLPAKLFKSVSACLNFRPISTSWPLPWNRRLEFANFSDCKKGISDVGKQFRSFDSVCKRLIYVAAGEASLTQTESWEDLVAQCSMQWRKNVASTCTDFIIQDSRNRRTGAIGAWVLLRPQGITNFTLVVPDESPGAR